MTARRGFGFGSYVVDPVRRLVWEDGELLSVTGKAFEILVFLLEHRDRVVEKDELLKSVWPDTFVQENNLVRHVSTLRRALGQRADQHDCILTVQGRGYQFVADVTELDSFPIGFPTAPAAIGSASPNGSGPSEGPAIEPASEPAADRPPPALALGGSGVSASPLSRTTDDAGAYPERMTSMVRRTTHEPSRPMSWAVFATVGAALAVAIAGAAVLVGEHRTQPMAAQSPPVLRQVTYGPSTSIGPAWSPDGKSLAYASDRDGKFGIWVQRLDGSEPLKASSSSAEDWQPSWSPDGQWLAFRSEDAADGGIYEVSLNGGMMRRVSDFGYRPRWSPDGSRILYSNSLVSHRPRPQLFVVGMDGGTPQEVRPDLTAAPILSAAWAPDGRVAIWRIQPPGQWSFVTAPTEGNLSTTFTVSDELVSQVKALGLQPTAFTWSADGRSLIFDGLTQGVQSLWRVGIDAVRATISGPLERLTTGAGSDRDAAISPDGTRVAYSSVSESTRIWSFALNPAGQIAGTGVPVTLGGAGQYDAAVSADGRKLIYRTTRDGRQEVWERTIDDGSERRLISGNDGDRSSPRWSPDGTRLAYQLSVKQPRPGVSLAVFGFSDMREQVLTVPGAPSLIPDDWSHDGSLILGPCVNTGSPRLGACVASAVGPTYVRSVAADPSRDFRSLRFSPDERWISAVAVNHSASDGSAIVVIPFAGGAPIAVTDGSHYDQKPVWGSDSRTVYFVSNRTGFFNVWGRHFDPVAGAPVGEAFPVTSLATPRQMIAPNLDQLEIAVAAHHLYVPVTESTGQVFILQNPN